MRHHRQGILGLETEHVVLFVPDEVPFLSEAGVAASQEKDAPPFAVIEKVLFESLLHGRQAALSGGPKGGYFLDNGGQVHLELYLHEQAEVPILEVATPECRTPRDVLVYSRAFDAILEETSTRSREVFQRLGFHGRIAFGKTNVDARGTGLGCHENYLIHSRAGWGPKCLLAALVPLLTLCVFPVYLFFLIDMLRELAPRYVPGIRRALDWLRRRAPQALKWARSAYSFLSAGINLPFLQIYAFFVRNFILRRHIRALTPFLVTRQILTGAGHLDFHGGVYELSQRAALTRRLASIIFFGRGKTIFDLKSILFDRSNLILLSVPFWLFQPTNRLSLAVGDANMSDVPNLLKLGVTSLIIEMLEAGETFADLRLRRPIRALRSVSRQGPWQELKLRSGLRRTSLEIQREYLRRAQMYFRGRGEGSPGQTEILQLWAKTLDTLADTPHGLGSELDWMAKKQLLDQAILPRTSWKVFFAWGKVFSFGDIDTLASAPDLHDFLGRLSFLGRFRAIRAATRAGLDANDFDMQRELHFQAQKIDFKYHELGGGSGYQRRLEADGILRRLTDPEHVEKATRTPPQDTRARVRAQYIQQCRRPETLLVTWNEIELQSPPQHISIQDPFQFRLPME